MTHRSLRAGRRVALLVLASLAVGLFVAVPAALANHPLSSLAGSNFEIDDDANLRVDDAGKLDWANVAESRQADTPSGKNDDSYKGGGKEDDPCPAVTTGSIPPNKSDLLNFGVYEEAGDPGFLHLFWHRVQEPSGTTLMDFEFNQSNVTCANGVNKVRTPGDLLLEYRLDGGGSKATIFFRTWTGTAWSAGQDISASGSATGTINTSAIPAAESDGLGDISPRTFGEASIDLGLIFDADECKSFGSAMLKSRSSTSFTSDLKDLIKPVGIELSNCGSVKINKTDDAGTPLDGAVFTLYKDNPPVGGALGAEDTAVDSCTTVAGTCTITDVLAGDYWIDETTVPAGHEKDPALPHSFSVDADENVVLSFANPRNRGSILVRKVDDDGNALDGAAFAASPDGTGPDIVAGSVNVPPVEGQTGVFCLDGLLFGEYTASETTTPSGYSGAADQTFTVASSSTCEDRLGDTPDLTFVNEAQHKVVVIVCHEPTGTLAESDVTLGSTTKQTLPKGSALEAQLCALDGFGGLGHDTVSPSVNVGNKAH